MARMPARVLSTMIHIENSTTVRMIVVSPRPNSTMITGTRALSGAERKRFTQGRRSRSAMTERPIRIPSGTPRPIAMALPNRKARPVISSASRNEAVGTISTTRQMMRDSGGRMNPASVWPTISQITAQTMSDVIVGRRTPEMTMAAS